jgi:hypothetical protein
MDLKFTCSNAKITPYPNSTVKEVEVTGLTQDDIDMIFTQLNNNFSSMDEDKLFEYLRDNFDPEDIVSVYQSEPEAEWNTAKLRRKI